MCVTEARTDGATDSILVGLTLRTRHGKIHENPLLRLGKPRLEAPSLPSTFISVLGIAVLQLKETRGPS